MAIPMHNASWIFDGDKCVETIEGEEVSNLVDEEKSNLIRRVCETVIAYLNASQRLCETKYLHLKQYAPAYLMAPRRVLVFCSSDGVAIRYETGGEKKEVLGVWNFETLANGVKSLSQNIVRLLEPGQSRERTDADGIELTMFAENAAKDERRTVAKSRFLIDVELEKPIDLPRSPRKPFCLATVRSEVSLFVRGELITEKRDRDQPFLSYSRMKIPVGWDCIEIYPFLDLELWNPNHAELWAETDLLASAAVLQHRESQLSNLDPTAAARTKFAAEMDEFKKLLDSAPAREEELHQFLKRKPHLLCPTKIAMWSKLAFGGKVSDFVFQEATGEYLLVEIERSTLPLFIKTGDMSAELNHACSQITDWKRYIEDNLRTVQNELQLFGITSNPNSLVVIGRAVTLTEDNRRKLMALQKEVPTRRIFTYDDVYDNAKAVLENLFGPLIGIGGNARTFYIPSATPLNLGDD